MAPEISAVKMAVASLAVAVCVTAHQDTVTPPLVDHHQHLCSPATSALVSTPAMRIDPITAADLISLLDAAGIRRAVVFSMGYTYGHVDRKVENEYEKVKAENDWTSAQVGLYPDRLRAFCSFNPLKDYALDELARCLEDPRLRFGLKLHFGNGDINVHDAKHVARLQEVFRIANRNRMPIIVHMRSSISRGRPYGAKEARIFLSDLVPAAPDVTIQIAHLAGGGGYDDPLIDQAMSVFTGAVARRDPGMKNLYFDVSGVVRSDTSAETAKLIATRIRQLGIERVLYGSDAAAGGNPAPREAWAGFRKLPLSDTEFRSIAGNVAPYLR